MENVQEHVVEEQQYHNIQYQQVIQVQRVQHVQMEQEYMHGEQQDVQYHHVKQGMLKVEIHV